MLLHITQKVHRISVIRNLLYNREYTIIENVEPNVDDDIHRSIEKKKCDASETPKISYYDTSIQSNLGELTIVSKSLPLLHLRCTARRFCLSPKIDFKVTAPLRERLTLALSPTETKLSHTQRPKFQRITIQNCMCPGA